MSAKTLKDVDGAPQHVKMLESVTRQGDPTRRTQTEVYTAYVLKVHGGAAEGARRARSHCRFRKRGAEYIRKCGIKWMDGSAKRYHSSRAQILPEASSGC
jgi:hypothetical protein